MTSSKKRVLVTGANGFTGRYLSDFLSSNTLIELHLADHAKGAPTPNFHLCDLSDASATVKLIMEMQPHAVYHLVGSYTNEYDTDYVSNVVTTKNMLDAVRRAGTKTRVLLVGSSAEYGFPREPNAAVAENHPCRPVSVYGLVKLMQTALMGTYVRLYGMDIVAVRPFNLFGTGISPTLFVGKMEQEIARYKRGEIKEIITGDLSVERDYIEITKAIGYYVAVLEKGKTGEIYNVGSGKSTALRDVLRNMLISEGLSFDAVKEGIHHIPGKIVVPKIFSDITKLRQLF